MNASLAACLLAVSLGQTMPFQLNKGDHVSIVGNTLADRMQHSGWLETLIHSRFPQHDLVFRNLGFSGDELTLRLRSAGFGSPDEWLRRTKTDVIFAFFGYNESFAGPAGLEKFKKDLSNYLMHLQSQKYNGVAPPRIVLFSPIVVDRLNDPNLPDWREHSERLRVYSEAMAEVAEAQQVIFVDLFAPSVLLFARAKGPCTINGVHLNEEGNKVIAEFIDWKLFGRARRRPPAGLHAAVLERNHVWFNRYRTVDGYSIFGGRADLKFTEMGSNKINTNREVAQREMEILDVMTANRDKAVWAAARGEPYKIDDGNTPPFIEIKTNKPGSLPNGKHLFLGGEEAIAKMTLGKNLKINLFASEETFKDLVNPVQMQWDTHGRLWVAVWPTYPHWKPKAPMNDKLLVFSDTDGDGKADKMDTFADNLHCPTGFELWNGGVLIAQAPDLVFLKDTDGDGKADFRERVLSGLDSADTHHTANSFVLDPGGAIYFQEGTFHHTQVETPWGPPVRCANAGVFRYEPRTHKFDVYVAFGFANPHGHVFDRWGQDIVVDGTGAVPYHAALFSSHMPYPNRHNRPPQVYQQKTRPCPGMEYLSSKHFPDDFQGNLLVPNVIGFHGILRYKVEDDGASFKATELEPILSSTDPNFRPSDVRVGPDGAIYFIDWHNPIIGHMQHNLRDPNRDVTHGRIYRVTYDGRPLSRSPKITGEPVDKVLDLLKHPEDRVRYRARIELGSRPSDQVIAAVQPWIERLAKDDAEHEHHLMEALWLHQSHNVVNEALLRRMLSSPDFRARAAATRVLCYWRDQVSDALNLLKKQAGDEHPRVRLEAVRASSFVNVPEAVEVTLVAQERPVDQYVDFVAKETMRTLEPIWKAAVAQNKPVNVTTDAGARFFLRNISLEQLAKMERTRPVNLELLLRAGVRDETRRDALGSLAKQEKKSELRVLFDAIARIDAKKEARDETVIFDLVRLLGGRKAEDLAAVRAEVEKLATSAKQPVVRQIGFVSLVNLDGSAEKAWQVGLKSRSTLRDLLAAVPMIADASLRASLYPKIEPLLDKLPAHLDGKAQKGTVGRFVRIELKGKKTLTLAEVEVFSEGRNVARGGKASQKNTAHGGAAGRAIDGNKSTSFGDGGQTHTQENARDPWWELDLGQELPIESIAVYNRADGDLGNRLDGFTLQVLDSPRNVVHQQVKIPAPAPKATFALGGEPANALRQAAMLALTSVRGQETKTFETLARHIKADDDRLAAVRAMQRIGRQFWPKDDAKPLADVMLAHIRKIPAKERTAPAALDALEFADTLTTLLPADLAKQYRSELGELGVRVIRLLTLPERMAYDKDVIVVEAGRPVEFLFENVDLMPHNFVIGQPGSLEELGKLAEATAQDPGAAARHFVPPSNKILLASQLLQPRESQKLGFAAPTAPGVYPYVCTYPSHWMRMHGALYVVASLEDYRANPDAYLAKANLPVRDDLLKDRRPRTEWKFDELAPAVAELKAGRSFGNGKQMFQVAACVACHKLDNAGAVFGPDLAQLDVKKKPLDVLKDLLEPSAVIHEKFQTMILQTSAGKQVTGIILEETKDAVKLIENPLLKADPIVLKTQDIEFRTKSPQSIMPKGLLDKLSRDEILDLLAFVLSRGNREHPLFRGDTHEHRH
jgi:putative heme-binding domain-containing protein